MAEDNKNLSDNTSVKKDVAVQSNRPQPDNIKKDEELEYKKPDNFLQTLFAGNNTLTTVEDGPLEVDDDTRKMLALFSDGIFFVDENKVLNFIATIKRRKVLIGNPRYVTAKEIATIYEYAAKNDNKDKKTTPLQKRSQDIKAGATVTPEEIKEKKDGKEEKKQSFASDPIKEAKDILSHGGKIRPSEIAAAANRSKEEMEVLTKADKKKSDIAEEKDVKEDNVDLAKSANYFQVLFSNDNKLLTAEKGEMQVEPEIRRMIALFSDGTCLIDEAHRFDGKVLNFIATIKRRKISLDTPRYVSSQVITAVYAYAERGTGQIDISVEESAAYQIQIDFLDVISRAARKKVSDIHVVVADSTVVLFRVNGMMERELEYSSEWGEAFVRAAFASADISDANYAQNEFQGAQKLGATPLRGTDGKLKLPHNVLAIRLQFNPVAFGSQYLVMRLLYADDNPNGNSDLRTLGLGDREIDLFYRLRATAVGLKIIAGPTGSGKSTTLQRNLIKLIQEHHGEMNVITVEDPPEYPIRQMPVTNASSEEEKDEEFNKALSAALRSDPDVLMVGEIRSLSAASLVFKGALSGHSVWSTLHANSAPAIITRLRDMGVQPYMLDDPEIMKGLISQRLFRKLCPYCRVSVKERMSDPSFQRLKTALGEYGTENTYVRGPGCKYCGHKGIVGRLSVPEIILPDAHFLRLLIKGETKEAIDYWISELDGRPLREAAIERMLKGYIDLDEVERWCGLLDQRPVY